jgi:hypothetical protein
VVGFCIVKYNEKVFDATVLQFEVLTNSVEQSPFLEANSHLASQEIPLFLWNLKFHYHVHNILPLPLS